MPGPLSPLQVSYKLEKRVVNWYPGEVAAWLGWAICVILSVHERWRKALDTANCECQTVGTEDGSVSSDLWVGQVEEAMRPGGTSWSRTMRRELGLWDQVTIGLSGWKLH